jgi:hypothetical protein
MAFKTNEFTAINNARTQINKEIKKLLNSGNSKKCLLTMNILNEIKDKRYVNLETTTLANLIFLRENKPEYDEQYKDFLNKMNLCTSYFEIPRLLRNDQYEQAVLLGISEFDKLSKNEYVSIDRLVGQLRLYNILEEASKRNDTQIILDLMDLLKRYNLLHNRNMSSILVRAFEKSNDEILNACFDFVLEGKFTDNFLKGYINSMIRQNEIDKALKILTKIESIDLKRGGCIEILSTLEFNECMDSIEYLIGNKILSEISYDDLSSAFISIPNLDDYENISNKMEKLKETSSMEIKNLVIYSLLSSIDNTNKSLASTIFFLNGLDREKSLLNETHKDIIFHQLSKYPSKLTSIKLYEYFKSLGMKITEKNYYYLIKSQCHGTEIDTLFYVLIQMLNDHGKLTIEIIKFLEKVKNATNNNYLKFFLMSEIDIETIKEAINYEFIKKNLEYQRERTKLIFPVMEGFTKYDYKQDIKLVDSFKV